jgi:hypothetical protein
MKAVTFVKEWTKMQKNLPKFETQEMLGRTKIILHIQ